MVFIKKERIWDTVDKEKEQNKNMMYCPDCGKYKSRQAEFCPNCGHPFKRKIENGLDEKIVVKKRGMKAISYITTVIGYFLSFRVFGIGFIIPLA